MVDHDRAAAEDEATDLAYYGFRFYDKTLIEWTQPDPLYRFLPDFAWSQPRRGSLYEFSLEDPLRFLDPDGRDSNVSRWKPCGGGPCRLDDGRAVYDQGASAAGSTLYQGGVDAANQREPEANADEQVVTTAAGVAVSEAVPAFGFFNFLDDHPHPNRQQTNTASEPANSTADPPDRTPKSPKSDNAPKSPKSDNAPGSVTGGKPVSRPYDPQIAAHALDRGHYPVGTRVESIMEHIAEVRGHGQPYTAANGNVLYRYKNTVLIDNIALGGEGSTIFSPDNMRLTIATFFERNM